LEKIALQIIILVSFQTKRNYVPIDHHMSSLWKFIQERHVGPLQFENETPSKSSTEHISTESRQRSGNIFWKRNFWVRDCFTANEYHRFFNKGKLFKLSMAYLVFINIRLSSKKIVNITGINTEEKKPFRRRKFFFDRIFLNDHILKT
jgi:hypothetical protein